MPAAIVNGPIWLLIGALFVIVSARAQGTYWLARAVAAGIARTTSPRPWVAAMARWFSGPIPRRGKAALERWGIVIIPLCFLTVGFQTAVIAGAGLLRMDWRRFTVAMLPGALAWAVLYGLGLLAIWLAAIQAIAGSWWLAIAVVAVVAGALIGTRYLRRRTDIDTPAPHPSDVN